MQKTGPAGQFLQSEPRMRESGRGLPVRREPVQEPEVLVKQEQWLAEPEPQEPLQEQQVQQVRWGQLKEPEQ